MKISKLFYRLEELATRWGCTVNDLLHLGIQDHAQICVNIYGMATQVTQRREIETEVPDQATDEQLEELGFEITDVDEHDRVFKRWLGRTTKDMPHGIFELGLDTLRFCEMPDGFPHELNEAMKFDRGGWWTVEFPAPVAIRIDHLCMLHEEVVRLDSDVFGLGAEKSADRPLNTRERRTFLTLVAALCKKAGIDASSRSATSAIQSATEELGTPVGDDKIRSMLKDMAEAIDSRRS